ncbi:hypothetical protein P175DRAFT_0258990 [Aspergillus ochraceoroseus IBT 24754]|uniref:ferric-chelate reductase (NADPH) n=2 Tax=Aspergillus ochraceoroseus TaxID=138278 RepID=A0A2T5LUF0_9EURO|nr:uncharacterized protein P175DRAFT_0258990 [Aspergillus ochraceoroseus IBT 24754]KKK16804.1 hypothetical protein AOCH_003305 [Aspergillus ochraceoroseus]PTU19883.1 hypothetical protein P175DRAFT_0258990 [Aspergillus ochraceoroseus IBT 24754]
MGVDLIGPGGHRSKEVHPPMNIALATPLFVLAGAFGILFIVRVLVKLQLRQRLRAIHRGDDQSRFEECNSLISGLNKHVFYAPLLSTRHSREFRIWGDVHMGTVPLRLEALLLAAYIAVNLIFFFSLVDWWKDYQEVTYELKYAAGHLAVMNTPALVLTAGRNNPLIPLLGIQFDTFNLLHRWVGRLIVVGAIVHMACVVAGKSAQMSMGEITHLIWTVPFFIYGIVALIAFVLILIQSVSPIRHAFYEAFLHFHIALAIMAFVGLWYHLKGLTQQRVLLATLILWGLERAGRLGSLIWRNCGKHRTRADVELLPGNVARVTVRPARPWTFKAGQYMYLYIPSLGLWTSHPFSVAWISSNETKVTEKRGSGDSFNLLLEERQQPTVSFLIRRRDGFTSKLLQKVNNTDQGQFCATALAEGPFGGLHSLTSYGTIVLIAGGIGITHPMSYMHEFVEGFAAQTIAARRVSLVWVVRSLDHLAWVQPWMTSLLNHPAVQIPAAQKQHSYFQLPEFSLSIQIYVTDRDCSSEEYMSDESPWASAAPPSVPVHIGFGKPCFNEVLEAEQAKQVGAMAVSVCGPGGMGDDVRSTVRKMQGTKTVDLYEETFSW